MSAFDETTLSALREAGLDPDAYIRHDAPDMTPDVEPEPAAEDDSPARLPVHPRDRWRGRMTRRGRVSPEPSPDPIPVDESLPEDLRGLGYTGRQMDYAIRQEQDPARRLDMYARMNDVRRMADVARNSAVVSEDELERLSQTLNIPPNLTELLAREYPDELERRKLYARMVSVAGQDSYFVTRFSREPNYAALQRGHEMELANLQAALTNAYGSTGDIITGWLKNASASAWTETVYGIPAGASQMAKDIRDLPWTPEGEMPAPEGTEWDSPAAAIWVQGLNQQIREKNEAMEALLADPETQAQAARNRDSLDDMDRFLQDGYLDRSAASYAGDTRTGNWWVDNLVRSPVEGAPSFAMAAAETAVLGPVAPLVHFGALASTSSYREMRAEDIEPGIALPLALVRGGLEGYIESLSMENIFKGAGIRDFFRQISGHSATRRAIAGRILGHGLKGGAGEAAEEVLQGAAEAATLPLAKAISLGDPYSNVFTAIYESGEDLAKQGWGGFVLGFFGSGFLGNTRRELADLRKYNSFQKALTPLVAAGDAAVAGGKSVAEVRREVRVMAHTAAAKGKGDMGTTVYADPDDVETYLQGKPREAAEKTLAAVGVTPEAFQRAKADRTDIEIPMENLAVQEGGADAKLTRLFRPTPNMATAAAIVERTRKAADLFELARSLRKDIDADAGGRTVPVPIQALRQDLRANLGYKAEEADFIASMAWAWGRTQAERRGVDVDQFLADANIRAAMDAWIQRRPAWLAGARARPETIAGETETTDGADRDAPASIDPAMGERDVAVPEQPGDGGGGVPGAEPATAAQPVGPGSGEAGGQPVRPSAPVPERTLFSPPPRTIRPGEHADRLTGLPFSMETTTTTGIKTDPGAFQFKREADAETGVKRGEAIPGDVNPAALGTMVLYEDVDGDRFVVSGHHRLDLLRRKGEEAEVRAVILRENDGWTTDHARVYGAALNIQEGGGDVDDYAAFFREAKIGGEQAAKEGLLRRENARVGYAIGAHGSDNVFYGFLNEELSAKRAAAIAAAAPGDHAIQDMMIERKIPTAELETFAGYVKKMQNSGALALDGVQLSLFAGADHSALLAAMEKESRAAAKEAGALYKKAASLESLLKAGKTLSVEELRKHGARAGDREGLRLEAAELRAEADRWRNFFHHPDILAQVQERAGTAVVPVESFRQAERESRSAAVELKDGGFTVVDPVKALARLDTLEKMQPVEIRNELTGIGDVKALRGKAKTIYDTLQPVRNVRDNRLLRFVPSAFKKIRSHSADPRIMQAIPSLPELFELAVPLYSAAPREGVQATAVAWHTYAVKVGEGEYVRLTAWETKNGELELDFHDINYSDALKQEKREQSTPAVTGYKPGAPDATIPSKDTIRHWIDIVKSIRDGDVKEPGAPETFEQDQRDSDEQATTEAIGTYGSFFEEAMRDRKTNQPYRDMLRVSQFAADMVKERLGIIVSGSHGVEGSALRHSDNHHGVGKEKWKGQGEIDRESFSLVPLIVNAPDNVYDGGEIIYREKNTGIEKRMKRVVFEKK